MKKIENFTSTETRFLSNFYPHRKDGSKYPIKVDVVYNGIHFDCVENAYQAAKLKNKEEQLLLAKLSPYEAKEYFLTHDCERSDWEDVKLQIMEDLVFQKFSTSRELKEMLLQTQDAVLEEGNDWGDTFWGICNGEGENHLGKILMKVRQKLK